jgi:hypothetical protein
MVWETMIWDEGTIWETEYTLMFYFINGIFRFPLGLVEPYVAAGPVYAQYLIDGEPYEEPTDSLGLNVRGGVDFNILDWLSVGVEANYFVDSFEEFFDDAEYYFSEDGLREKGLVGVTAKFKF